MVHLRFSSIAVALASILASGVESADTRGSSGLRLSKDASASKEASIAVDAIGRMIKYEKTDENGVKCTAGADKKKMSATRECEGGAKEEASIGIGSQELAKDVSSKLRDMHFDMLPEKRSVHVPGETMEQMMYYDALENFVIDDCTFGDNSSDEEVDKCEKKFEFGGYFKLFWGCNMTIARKGMSMTKNFGCGGKSFEGVGKAEDMGYYEAAIPEVGANDDTEHDLDGWIKAKVTVEQGGRCKESSEKGKECEGGMKKVMSIGVGSQELAEDVSDEIQKVRSKMVPDHDSIVIPDEIMAELMSWDEDDGLTFLEGEHCSEEDEGCSKKVEFGGMQKLFWGCNVTFSKKGMKMSKDVTFGFKFSDVMGVKP